MDVQSDVTPAGCDWVMMSGRRRMRPSSVQHVAGKPLQVSLHRLAAFIAVADAGAISRAARDMGLTAPALTKSVRELERALGAELFYRTSTGMMLTPAGELFYARAKVALAEIALGATEVAEMNGGPAPRVVVGALPDALNPVLPEAVARRIGAARRGDAGITLRGGWFDQLSEQTRVGDVDFFVSAVPEGAMPDGLAMEVLYHDDLVVVARLGHPLAERAALTLADLTAFHWVVPTKGTALDQLLRKAFRAEGLSALDSWSEVNPIGSLRAVVSQSDVVVATGRLRVRDELSRGLFRELPLRLPAAHHAVGVFYRSHGALSRPARQLLATLRDVSREYAADDGREAAKPRG